MALLPYTLCMGIYWYARWFVKFSILKHAYGQAEREYLTRVTLGLNEVRFPLVSRAFVFRNGEPDDQT